MKVVLRLIAALQGVVGLADLLMTLMVVVGGGPPSRAQPDSVLTWLPVVLMALAGPIGLFGAIQLFRFRESGRLAALACVALTVLGAMTQYSSEPKSALGLRFGIFFAIALTLISKQAKHLCVQPSSTNGALLAE
jgi:hypothetical protein